MSMLLEITVLSVEGLHLHRYASPLTALCCTPITPFVTLTKIPPTNGDKPPTVATWDHKIRVPVDSTFFSDTYSSLHLQLFTKRRILGQVQLGWCLIPASDFGFLPSGSLRYLSYRLRAKDGSRGHGIINLSIRLDACQTVIGMPVTAIWGMGDCETKSGRESNGGKLMMNDDGGAKQIDRSKKLYR